VVLQCVCAELDASPEQVRAGSRRRAACAARAATAALARNLLGEPVARIATKLGVSDGAATRCIRRGDRVAAALRTTRDMEHAGEASAEAVPAGLT